MNRTTLSLIAGAAALAAVTGFAVAHRARTAPPPARRRRPPSCPWSARACSARRPAPPTSPRPRTRRSRPSPRAPASGAAEGRRGQGRHGRRRLRRRRPRRTARPTSKTDDAADGTKGGQEAKAPKPVLAAEGARQARHRRGERRRRARARRHRRRAARARLDRPADHRGRRGQRRGLLGVSCTAPDTDFWFPGASTAKDRTDYVHLTNPDDSAAVADIELYGPEGVPLGWRLLQCPQGEPADPRHHHLIERLVNCEKISTGQRC